MQRNMPSKIPQISIIIPTFNEADFIAPCITSLLEGDYPSSKIELLVIDGGSTDETCAVVNSLRSTYQQIKLLHNPKKIVPSAMNIGIEAASNEIIIWVGAHALYQHDYLLNCVRILLEEDCASVGGIIKPIGKTMVGKAIAIATVNKFGIGNAKYRNAKNRQSVDTVFGGCWKKENVLKVGGFNEKWVRNQDYEFNHRLRTEIGEIILDPSICCEYYCRESLSGLAKQYFGYGFWRFQTLVKHPSSFSPRQAAPLLLLLGLLFSLIILFFNPTLGLIIPSTYLVMSLAVSITLSIKTRKLSHFFLLPLIFATLHLSWAFGFYKNAIKTALRNLKLNK